MVKVLIYVTICMVLASCVSKEQRIESQRQARLAYEKQQAYYDSMSCGEIQAERDIASTDVQIATDEYNYIRSTQPVKGTTGMDSLLNYTTIKNRLKVVQNARGKYRFLSRLYGGKCQ